MSHPLDVILYARSSYCYNNVYVSHLSEQFLRNEFHFSGCSCKYQRHGFSSYLAPKCCIIREYLLAILSSVLIDNKNGLSTGIFRFRNSAFK